MKLKQNAPLRVKISNTPTLLKPHSEKDTRNSIASNLRGQLILNKKYEFPNINLNNNNSNMKNISKNILQEEKKEEKIHNNINRMNNLEKISKAQGNTNNMSDSFFKSNANSNVI